MNARWWQPWRLRFAALSIRRKLLAMVLLPLFVVLPLLGLLLLAWSDAALDRLLQAKVRADLAVASGYFERVQARIGTQTGALADSLRLHTALQAAARTPADAQALHTLLAQLRQRHELDFIQLQRPDGTPWAGDAGRPAAALPLPDAALADTPPASAEAWPGAAPALGTGMASGASPALAQVTVLDAAGLQALSPALRERVAIALVPTRNASPSTRQSEERALLLLASAPVRDAGGALLGHIQAGVLLNRNLALIDQINDIVYPAGALPWGSQGTATLFLEDVRISTNVRLFGGAQDVQQDRAIGTRVSGAVREAVLGRGQTWLGRAFVVNAWYVSGYLPLLAADGRRVGMLYVGFSEAPFTWLKYAVLASIGVIFFAVMLGAGWVCLRWARSIFQPLERMSGVMQQVEAGDTRARVGPLGAGPVAPHPPGATGAPGVPGVPGAPADGTPGAPEEPRDEIGQLAAHFDHLLDVVADKTQALERWNAELDAKVAQRTQALQERTDELQATQRQLLRNEKLATMGQLTASIAHEVNNPIAVIQGNLDLMRELLPAPARQEVEAELALIDQQIERMRLIVTQLLQFARPSEYAGYVEAVPPAQALTDCLVLVAHLLTRQGIRVEREDRATRSAGINRQELQQVLVNLLVNAAQAMPAGGTLHLACFDCDTGLQSEHPGASEALGAAGSSGGATRPGVCIRVADTGPGLPEELLGELFQPFVTRKPDGTGLGLWISRSLVERYGGELHAANRPEGGAVLTLRLPVESAGL